MFATVWSYEKNILCYLLQSKMLYYVFIHRVLKLTITYIHPDLKFVHIPFRISDSSHYSGLGLLTQNSSYVIYSFNLSYEMVYALFSLYFSWLQTFRRTVNENLYIFKPRPYATVLTSISIRHK